MLTRRRRRPRRFNPDVTTHGASGAGLSGPIALCGKSDNISGDHSIDFTDVISLNDPSTLLQ